MKIQICKLDELSENQSIKFIVPEPKYDREAFAFMRNNEIYAYYNECPHIGIALDWDDNDFFSVDHAKLVCKNHGAEFAPDSGHCSNGPCVDTHLKPINVEISNDVVFAVFI